MLFDFARVKWITLYQVMVIEKKKGPNVGP